MLKLRHTVTHGTRTSRVYRDSEWDEFRVRLYVNGALNAPADSFHDDLDDAKGTARAMAKAKARTR